MPIRCLGLVHFEKGATDYSHVSKALRLPQQVVKQMLAGLQSSVSCLLLAAHSLKSVLFVINGDASPKDNAQGAAEDMVGPRELHYCQAWLVEC